MNNEEAIKNIRGNMGQIFYGMSIPAYMHLPLARYVLSHKAVGGFLKELLSNNLFETYEHADDNNIRNIPAYINFLYNYAPSACWGSPENYEAWIGKGK